MNKKLHHSVGMKLLSNIKWSVCCFFQLLERSEKLLETVVGDVPNKTASGMRRELVSVAVNNKLRKLYVTGRENLYEKGFECLLLYPSPKSSFKRYIIQL